MLSKALCLWDFFVAAIICQKLELCSSFVHHTRFGTKPFFKSITIRSTSTTKIAATATSSTANYDATSLAHSTSKVKSIENKPNVITVAPGNSNPNLEKFLMVYTCKKCDGRNAQLVSKVAYTSGMVVSTCKHCKVKHLVADNEGKLDMSEYGKTVEDYLVSKGEKVTRYSATYDEMRDNYLVDMDGVLTMVSKNVSPSELSNVTIIDAPSLSGSSSSSPNE